MRMEEDFKPISASLAFFLTFTQNKARDAALSKFIFNLSSVVNANNLSSKVRAEFKSSIDKIVSRVYSLLGYRN